MLQLYYSKTELLDETRTEKTNSFVDIFKCHKTLKKYCELTANFKRNQFVSDLTENPGKTQKYNLCVTLRFCGSSMQKSKEKIQLA